MTALIFHMVPEQVLIAMDTLVTDPGGTPIGFTSKTFPLMHIGGVMFSGVVLPHSIGKAGSDILSPSQFADI